MESTPGISLVKKNPRVAIIVGTRPEAIKMAPIIYELKKKQNEFKSFIISTAQHRHMLDQVFSAFSIRPEIDLNLMEPNQKLNNLCGRVLQAMEQVIEKIKPDCLLVQGDTTTAFAAGLAAFYSKIPVAHVEAGLRSHDVANPFPEEVNRHLISVVADLHFAPTSGARNNLLREGINPQKILVTGNTAVDAVEMMLRAGQVHDGLVADLIPFDGKKIVLVTCHRRESWGSELAHICQAIRDLVRDFENIRVIYPVHMNPNVRNTVKSLLGEIDRVHLIPPLDYFRFLSLMKLSYLILTDSGGVQEEAPVFKKPVLVLRKLTERPEAYQSGMAKIAGTSREDIYREAALLLENEEAYKAMAEGENPFGDGHAAQRIIKAVSRWMNGKSVLLNEYEEFQLQTVPPVPVMQPAA